MGAFRDGFDFFRPVADLCDGGTWFVKQAVDQEPAASPRSAKLMAVTTKATRLAVKRREGFAGMAISL